MYRFRWEYGESHRLFMHEKRLHALRHELGTCMHDYVTTCSPPPLVVVPICILAVSLCLAISPQLAHVEVCVCVCVANKIAKPPKSLSFDTNLAIRCRLGLTRRVYSIPMNGFSSRHTKVAKKRT